MASFLEVKNSYLAEHPRADIAVALRYVSEKIKKLKLDGWLSVEAPDRTLKLLESDDVLKEKIRLDGCYVMC